MDESNFKSKGGAGSKTSYKDRMKPKFVDETKAIASKLASDGFISLNGGGEVARRSGGNNRRNSDSRMNSRNGGSRGFGGRNSGGFGGNRKKRFSTENISYERYINKNVRTEAVVTDELKTFFKDLPLHPELLMSVKRRGFIHSTPIQDKAIPEILTGRNILGIAKTGTGKTSAFLIPLINQIFNSEKKDEQFLIIAPTRELALQIEKEIQTFTSRLQRIYSISCVGGSDIRKQIRALQSFYHFYVGTPGRLIDLIENKRLDISKMKAVVLDEVDRMLDMGFIADIEFILSNLPNDKQTLFFSATIPPSTAKIIDKYLADPVRVEIKNLETGNAIKQDIVKYTSHDDKFEKLVELIQSEDIQRGVIFTQMKITADEVSDFLYKRGISSMSIHSNKSLSQRVNVLNKFKGNRFRLLVATDVAARGIDVNDITHIINFDQPENYETYTHRIGRTGRAGKTGSAFTFIEDRLTRRQNSSRY